jgi:sphingomyelin phosphodiesterase acid-like 3
MPSVATRCRSLLLLHSACTLIAAHLFAQPGLLAPPSAAQPAHTKAPATIPALFLSDVHYDPLRDPALVPKLDAAPASQWPAILATPASPTQRADAAAVQKACPVRGNDPGQTLWQSSLQAIRTQAANARFMVLSGDLLPHSFECRYKFLFPAATHADFLNFAGNTLRYVVSSLRATLPGVPLYVALGNNDSACSGNSLDPNNDFLALAASIVAEALPPAPRGPILRDLAAGGYYSIRMAPPMPRTRLLVLDNLFFLTEFSTCAKQKDYSEETAQIAWLNAQIAEARRRRENLWVLGHIPPGVSLYTTFIQRRDICGKGSAAMSLDSEKMAEALAANADIVRLGIFAHTHSDAFAILPPGLGDAPTAAPAGPARSRLGPGVPVKVVASISAVNGNNPSFTLASIDPATATLRDYTVIEASNLTGIDATWTRQYSYAEDFAEPDFSPASLTDLIARFRADPAAATAPSQAYLRHHYSTGAAADLLKTFWPVYVCAMDHDSAQSFAACACATGAVPPAH